MRKQKYTEQQQYLKKCQMKLLISSYMYRNYLLGGFLCMLI